MSAPASERRLLWLRILVCHAILLGALFGWLNGQTRAVPMHDLQVGSGERLHCVSYAPFHRPGQSPLKASSCSASLRLACSVMLADQLW